MTYLYLGSPYSKYPAGIEAAFRDVSRQAALLVRCGIPIYSPIAHTHPIAVYGKLDPLDVDMWLAVDHPFMDLASGLIVCKLDGWQESRGLGIEIEHFLRGNKPIVYMEPNHVPDELMPYSTIPPHRLFPEDY